MPKNTDNNNPARDQKQPLRDEEIAVIEILNSDESSNQDKIASINKIRETFSQDLFDFIFNQLSRTSSAKKRDLLIELLKIQPLC